MEEFRVPGAWSELVGTPWASEERPDLGAMSDGAAAELCDGAAAALCEADALAVTERELFGTIYAVAEGFGGVPAGSRARLVDALCSNLSVLAASAQSLLMSAAGDAEAVNAHRSALKAYCFLIGWVVELSEKEARAAPPVPAAEKPAAKKGGKKGAAAKAAAVFDWDSLRERCARALAGALDVDLWALFRPVAPEEALFTLLNRTAGLLLEAPAALRNKGTRHAVLDMLGSISTRYKRLDTTATSLLHLLNKHEHLPAHIAEAAASAADRYQDAGLAAQLLREIGSVDPAEYKRQQQADAAGIRSVATLLCELAERMPKTVAKNVSLLVPHLSGEAYALRSALLTVVGHLIADSTDAGAAPEGVGAATALRTKQGLLDVLVQRTHDVNSFTRARALQTWGALAEKRAVPIGHWAAVTDIAVGRLRDKSANVRKTALHLLHTLLQFNPFAPQLPAAVFLSTSEEYTDKLTQAEEAAGLTQKEDPFAAAEGDAPVPGAEAPAEEPAAADEVPSQADPGVDGEATASLDGNVDSLRALVASLHVAHGFATRMSDIVPTLCELMASDIVSDVTETVGLVVTMRQFQVDCAEEAVRKMMGLVFSREQAVRDAAVDAAETLYMQPDEPGAAVEALVALAGGAALGELAALEQVLKHLVDTNRLPPQGPIVRALWAVVGGRGPGSELSARASALDILAMAAAASPEVVGAQLNTVLGALRAALTAGDGRLARSACCLLHKAGATTGLDASHEAFKLLLGEVLSLQSSLRGRAWFPAAEQAVHAVYALHPDPEQAMAKLLMEMATATGLVGVSSDAAATVSATKLARVVFTVGVVALKHLVHVEGVAKAVRKQRADREKRAAEAAAEADAEEDDPEGLAAQLGQGAASEDAELDAMRERAEAEIVAHGRSARGLLAMFAPLVAKVCAKSSMLAAHPLLRSAALSALPRLMAIDVRFCEANLQLLFTRLRDEREPGIRASVIVALGDLAFRFPNSLEPWTQHLYGLREWGSSLHDSDTGVRKHALTVLAHLVLNDMMKVRSHISDMATCMEDPEPAVASLAHLFFNELSHKVGNPIYNLLPDLLSRLSADTALAEPAYQRIMRKLISLIDKERQGEQLVAKLCARFPEALAADNAKGARDIAYCISQLPLGDKGFRKLAEAWKLYENALYDPSVAQSLKAAAARVKKLPQKGSSDLKAAAEEFEARIDTEHAQRAEDHATEVKGDAHGRAPETEASEPGEVEAETEAGEPTAAEEEGEQEPAVEAQPDQQPTEAVEPDAPQPDATPEEQREEPDENAEPPREEEAPTKRSSRSRKAPAAKVKAEPVEEAAPAPRSRRALRSRQ